MAHLRRFVARLWNAFRPGRAERDLTREMNAHLALLEDEFVRRGMDPEKAPLAARRAFGSVEHVKDLQRDARSFIWLDDARRDVHYTFRTLRKAPGFAMIAVGTLALGIGANAAIFSVVEAVLLQPLPYRNPSRLVRLYEHVPASESPNRRPIRRGGMALAELIELRDRSQTLSHVIGSSLSLVTMAGAGDAALVSGAAVSAGTFSMLGVPPSLGRWFTPDEEKEGAHVIVLGDEAWHRDFGADPRAIGRPVTFTGNSTFTGGIALGTAYSIVGIMPRGFHFPDETAQFWVPSVLVRPSDNRPRRTSMMAALRDDVSIDEAAAEIESIMTGVRGTALHTPGRPRFELVRVQDEVTAPVKPALLVLMGAVAFVLLIACANVANLLLARTAARQREMAVRISLGAGRGRLIRQALTESLMLALAGGGAGTALAFGGIRLFRSLATTLSRFDLGTSITFPRLADITIDTRVFLFVFAVSIVTGILFGLTPALGFSRVSQTEALRSSVDAGLGHARRGQRVQGILVVAEIAMAILLFVGGGLLVQSFVRLATVDLGYDISNTLTFQVGLRGDRYPAARAVAFADAVVERLRSVPGVVAAGYSRQLPMVQLEDRIVFRATPLSAVEDPKQDAPDARFVSPGYLQAVGARLAAGRWLDSPRSIVISKALARREFPGENPVGKTVYLGHGEAPYQVVGVVDDGRWMSLAREPRPQFFTDLSAWSGPAANLLPLGPYFVVRTNGHPESLLADIRAVVRQVEPAAPLYNIATLDQIVSNSLTLPRMYAVLLGLFAGLAIILAAIGIYGVVAYAVARRTREIGIRMALGARPAQVCALMLRQCGISAAAGTAVGLTGAALLTRFLQTLLFGVTPLDVPTFVAVALGFGAVALLAAGIPASRAARVGPAVALRCE